MMPLTTYTPAQVYTVVLTVQSVDTSRRRWGFQSIPLAGMTMAGAFPTPVINPNYQVLNNVTSMRQWVTHTSVGTAAGMTGGNAWRFRWNAPATDVGLVTYYVCANAADNNGNSSNDAIQCTTFPVMPTSGPTDTDMDGIDDVDEPGLGTDPNDADTDDDGVSDGDEANGVPGVRTDPVACDSDGDGLPDGLELGVEAGLPDTDPTTRCFAADTDSASTTDPTVQDTDGDTCSDAAEDANANGAVDTGETDPNVADCPVVVPSLLRVARVTAMPWPPNAAIFDTPPCTTPSDIRICAEADLHPDVIVENLGDPTWPIRIPGAGSLVFIDYDHDLTVIDGEGGDPVGPMKVEKDPASPGDLFLHR
jgi:hypothetical protein